MCDSDSMSVKKFCPSTTENSRWPLPDNVVDNILMRLPLRDAARTSILSSEWRYVWLRLPQLIFDHTFRQKLRLRVRPGHEYNYEDQHKIIMSVYEVLLFHRGPILKFKLAVPVLPISCEINKIVQFLSTSDIEDLTVQMSYGWQKLCPYFFSLSHLKSLCLHNCSLRPPASFRGFSQLLSLDLNDVIFYGDSIQAFISSCSHLERLRLVNCSGFKSLEINAPNLCYLHLVSGDEKLGVSIKYVPKLIDLSVRGLICSYTAEDFCNCMPSVEILHIDIFPEDFVAQNVSGRIPTVLNSLKSLHLEGLGFYYRADEISCALWLIRSSRNLTSIWIEFKSVNPEAWAGSGLELVKEQHCNDFSLLQLTEVQFQNVNGHIAQLEFMMLILAKSPNLKKFAITTAPDIGEKQKLKTAMSMAECRRASPVVELKFLEPKLQ